jgi:hypothetical protein
MSEKDHYKFGLSRRGKNVNDNNTLADDLRERIRELEAENARLLADVNQDEGYERLKSALRRYGDHRPDCAQRLSHYKGPVHECDCGWIGQLTSGFSAETASKPADDMHPGELWSFLRSVMMQGQDIANDYREKGYEEMSARLDVAAGDRVDRLLELLKSTAPKIKGE